MSDDIAPETRAEVVDATDDLSDLLKETAGAVKQLTEHFQKLLSEGVKLHPVEAIKQVPEAAGDVASDAGAAAGDVAQAGGHAVAAVPAVATDTLDTANDAGKASVRVAKRYTLRKGRR